MIVERSKREVIDAGVDYITATTTTRAGKKAFERIGFWELKKEEARGNETATYSAHSGQGIKCGSAEFMSHPDYLMLRFSSHLAKERWREIVEHSTNVSRLDLQATVKFDPPQDNLAEIVERHMLRFKRERNRKLEIELRRNDVKGKTLYTGSRKSDLFSRLYDKGKESKLEAYAGSWRLENQFGNRPAKLKASALLRANDTERAIVSEVSRYYQSRGAVVLNPSLRILVVDKLRLECGRNASSRLSWLRSQVRPGIEREVSKGNLSEVLEALGLDKLVIPIQTDDRTEE